MNKLQYNNLRKIKRLAADIYNAKKNISEKQIFDNAEEIETLAIDLLEVKNEVTKTTGY